MKKVLAKNVKKILRWGNGLAIFLTKESKALKWKEGDYISVSAIKDDKGERILIRKVEVA